jgi:hypothetical protein
LRAGAGIDLAAAGAALRAGCGADRTTGAGARTGVVDFAAGWTLAAGAAERTD